MDPKTGSRRNWSWPSRGAAKNLVRRRGSVGFQARLELEVLEDRTLLAAGILDATFHNDGRSTVDFGPDARVQAIAIQPDGMMVVAGSIDIGASDAVVARLTPDGFLDTSFNGGFRTLSFGGIDEATSLALQPDGKIVLAGFTTQGGVEFNDGDFVVARLTATGALDTTFSGDGLAYVDFGGDDRASAVAVRDDGRIVVAGTRSGSSGNFIVASLNADGTLDNSFGAAGKQNHSFGSFGQLTALALTPGGSIVLAGFANTGFTNDFVVMRLQANGTLDSSFSGDGRQSISFGNDDRAQALALQPDGKVVVAGTWDGGSADFALARLNDDGSLDTTFSSDGRQNLTFGTGPFGGVERARGVAVQPDGKIVVGGFTDAGSTSGNPNNFAVARLTTGGALDLTFHETGKTLIDFGSDDRATGLALAPDGRLVLAGYTNAGSSPETNSFALARLHTDRLLDLSFGGDGRQTISFGNDDRANAVAVQPDGKILLAGTWDGGQPDFAIVRLGANGTPDNSFAGDGRANFTFGASGFGGSERATAIALQPDGGIVVAGFTDAGGTTGNPNNFAIARLKPDGTLDNSFSGDGKHTFDFGADDQVHGILLQPDGRIVVVGYTRTDTADFAIARLHADGTLDTTFDGDGKATYSLDGDDRAFAVARQADGKLVLAGYTTSTPGGSQVDDFAFVRVLASGGLDTTFGGDGRVIADFGTSERARAVVVQPDGKIVAAGGATLTSSLLPPIRRFILVRLSGDGSVDTGFDGDGLAHAPFPGIVNDANGLVLQPDGKLVAAGQTSAAGPGFSFAVARFLANGTLDTTWGGTGMEILRFGAASSVAQAAALQRDGTLVVAGYAGVGSSNDFAVARLIGDQWIVVAPDQGAPPLVRIYGPTGTLYGEFFAYGASFQGGVRVAVADVNGDYYPDLLTAPGPGGLPFVNMFNGRDFSLIRQFQVYGESFTGGIHLAAADVLGTEVPQLLVGPDMGGEPYINIFHVVTGSLLRQVLAYGVAYKGGVRVATADVNGDYVADVLTAPQAGGAPFVNIFDVRPLTPVLLRQIQVYGETFTGGIYLATGDTNGDGFRELVVGPGQGGDPFVNTFDTRTGAFLQQYQAYGQGFSAGVRVGAVDINSDGFADIVTGPGATGQPYVKILDGSTGGQVNLFAAYDLAMTSGLFIVGVARW